MGGWRVVFDKARATFIASCVRGRLAVCRSERSRGVPPSSSLVDALVLISSSGAASRAALMSAPMRVSVAATVSRARPLALSCKIVKFRLQVLHKCARLLVLARCGY